MAVDHVTHLYTLDAATPQTRAFIEHMTPTWRSNARRYGLNKRQTDAHVARMVSQTIAERQSR